MKKLLNIFLSAAVLVFAVSCNKQGENVGGGSSTESYFFKEAFSYDLTSNPVIEVPVVRLGTSGDLDVSISADGPSVFTVPSVVTINDGDRVGNIAIHYNKADIVLNEFYTITLKVNNFTSVYGYESAELTLQMPTSYRKFGEGVIEEGWWGEVEEKEMYAREFDTNVLQCYLPDCWGHDSGPGYPVQDYVWFWDTETNLVYVPFQYMGCEDWMIADRGAVACMFGGPNYREGYAQWRDYIDKWYQDHGLQHPYYDPEKKMFYLSDTAALDPDTGEIAYGSAGVFDVFTLN